MRDKAIDDEDRIGLRGHFADVERGFLGASGLLISYVQLWTYSTSRANLIEQLC